jgi:NAD(P)H-hydrate epimerase
VPIVSLDCPSGLDSDRGEVMGASVHAALTLTFGLAKPGFFVNDGPAHVGRLRVLGIGFPAELRREVAVSVNAVGERYAARALPKRSNRSNKTTHGHLAVFAGHPGMWGAALLSCGAAYRMGAGYVTLASFADPSEVLRSMPEILTTRANDETFWSHRRWRAAALGPGFGTGAMTAELITRLKTLDLQGVVLDADGITVAARENLAPFPRSWVLTPHAGELSRLIGVDSKEIERDRFRYAREAARVSGCTVVLKGYRTVVASPRGEIAFSGGEPTSLDGISSSVILSGNSALAKAGTGDVLTGMIAGLIAQGVAPERAARAGAYLHGRLADEWLGDGFDRRSLQASDLSDRLPSLLKHVAAMAPRTGVSKRLSQRYEGGPW